MATQQWKHHAFISFRGGDTRHNFVCHLYDALCRKGLDTFVDKQLRTGKEINPALLQAIHDSKVAIIIFSKNYASSSWCLDELLKIIECHESETHNQIVIPVFYHVNPSDVRKQTGSFKKSFQKHRKNPRNNKKIQEWKDALTKAANISGWGSDVIREDNKLIDQIVRDVLEKLKLLYPSSLEDFVGLDSKISRVKKLLATGSSDVRMLGIWGMGGIGKTTIAETIFDEVSSQFEGRCFVRNVREVSEEKEGILKLLQQFISDLLEERDVKIYTKTVKPALRERLKSKRVFVVFDDVSDRLQLKDLIGNQSWLGAGSNIIVTSQDKQVFEGITDTIYKVEALSNTESHQLFVRYAFKKRQPSQDHIPLIGSFVNYARGNPLAIKVLGSYVYGKEVKLWKDALNKLSKCPNQKIQNVLKLSYDELDRKEKAFFLARFCKVTCFKGENIDAAKRIFSSCGLSADVGLDETETTLELQQGPNPPENPQPEQASPVLEKRLSQLASMGNAGQLKEFPLELLLEATNNFSEDHKTGTGSFGSVYRGVLGDGSEVAIKRAEASCSSSYAIGTEGQEDKDNAFVRELESLSRVHHKHLVHLLGFCENSNERILVYEYMHNGTLHDHLHNLQRSPLMTWPARIKLALDAARGIEYLHEYAVPPIIHRDIKSSNILLDSTWTAKVSDFGLSLMGPSDDESHLSLKAAGTVGYMDPEYYRLQQLTTKSDVYSFGVVLLELLSGYKAIHRNENGVPRNVVDFVVPYIVQDEIHRVLDRRVPPPTPFEIEAVAYIGYLAADCVTLEGRDRPPMTEVVNSLERALAACLVDPTSLSRSNTESST